MAPNPNFKAITTYFLVSLFTIFTVLFGIEYGRTRDAKEANPKNEGKPYKPRRDVFAFFMLLFLALIMLNEAINLILIVYYFIQPFYPFNC